MSEDSAIDLGAGGTNRALFLQPHCDAALSCGGTAALLAEEGGQVQLVSVFAREAADLRCGSSIAARRPAGTPDTDEAITLQRAEDALAAAVLGCSARWLGLPGARHRNDGHAAIGACCGVLERDQRDLALFIALEVLHLEDWCEGTHVFVPIAAGKSLDHQLVFEAGRTLAAHGVSVWAYEDLPCAIHSPAALRARLAQVRGVLGDSVRLTIDEVLPRKLDAISCYASRLPTIFPFEQDYRSAVADHAWQLGGQEAHACERFWPVAR